MRPHYHDTTDIRGPDLDKAESKAKTQDEKILEYYRRVWPIDLSPSEVQKRLHLAGVPLTSIRRAISNLTSAGHLVKTDRKVDGLYGRPEYTWRFNRLEPTRQARLF